MSTTHHHPAVLYALTATWQLAKSRHLLAQVVQEDAADRAARASTDTRDGLRSQVFGTRHALGGHADPVAGRINTSSSDGRPAPMARLAESVDTTVHWLAGMVCGDFMPGQDALTAIRTGIPDLPWSAAGHAARWLTDEDSKIRRTLGLVPDHLPVPNNRDCPACGLQMLRIVTSAPSSADWVIVCTNTDCTCRGAILSDPPIRCRCGMPVTGWGQRHIWDRSTPLVDGLLRTMPRRRARSGRRTVVDVQAETGQEVAA